MTKVDKELYKRVLEERKDCKQRWCDLIIAMAELNSNSVLDDHLVSELFAELEIETAVQQRYMLLTMHMHDTFMRVYEKNCCVELSREEVELLAIETLERRLGDE